MQVSTLFLEWDKRKYRSCQTKIGCTDGYEKKISEQSMIFEINMFDWTKRLWIGKSFLSKTHKFYALRSDYYQKYEDLKYSHTRMLQHK